MYCTVHWWPCIFSKFTNEVFFKLIQKKENTSAGLISAHIVSEGCDHFCRCVIARNLNWPDKSVVIPPFVLAALQSSTNTGSCIHFNSKPRWLHRCVCVVPFFLFLQNC